VPAPPMLEKDTKLAWLLLMILTKPLLKKETS
jgi:hypothetical protein